MHLVTGGAGFIGSNIVAALSDRGEEVVVCDQLGIDDKWRNLAKHELADLIHPRDLMPWLSQNGKKIQSVIHMGAISATTETDVDLIIERNVRSSLDLVRWCTESSVRLIYASSAATYGSGAAGFDDTFSSNVLARHHPLNAYGWSKHVVDRRIARIVEQSQPLPPQWVGLKFFNVYGPNEYHKGSMRSVIAKQFDLVRTGEPIRLFRSRCPEYADGGQLRDFIYVRDCADIVLWFLDHPDVSGLYNAGTGTARSWLDLANALFDAAERPRKIEFVDMPDELVNKYQYFTQATVQRLRAAGYDHPFTTLESGVRDFVRSYLATEDRYR